MFRLLKLVAFVAGLAAFAWFGITVKLGERTLFQHLAAIGGSEPSQELLRGAKEKVGELGHMLGRGGEGGGTAGEPGTAHPVAEAAPAAKPEGKPVGKPSERLTQSDRHQMRRLIESSRRPARN